MEMDLQGFQVKCEGYAELFCKSGDRWFCRKDSRQVNTFEVTLMRREDKSRDPISAWVFSPKLTRITFKVGEKVKINCLCKWFIPAVYYIKRTTDRKKFYPQFNLRRSYLIHDRIVNDPESNLQFMYQCGAAIDSCSISVIHREGMDVTGEVRIFSWDLEFNTNLYINRKNIIDSGVVPYRTTIIYLEEIASVKNIDENGAPELASVAESLDEHQLIHYIKSNPTSGDVKLVAADGSSVVTHNLLIEARSKLLEVEKVEKAPVTEIKLQVETKHVIEEFVHFLVHDSVRDMQSNSLGLFELACKYEVTSLRQLCEEHFEDFKVTSETVERVSNLLKAYKSGSLFKALLKYQSQMSQFKMNPRTIVEDLATGSDDICDVTLKSRDNKEVHCSSFLLLCRSGVFDNIEWHPGRMEPILMANYDGDVLEQLLHFLRTDTVMDMRTHALQLLLLADEYKIAKLAIDCIDYITSHIQEFNLYEVAEVSRKVSASSKLAQAVLNSLPSDDSLNSLPTDATAVRDDYDVITCSITSQDEHQLVYHIKRNPTSGDAKLIAADGGSVATHLLLIEAKSKLLEVEKVQMPPVTEIKLSVETKNVLEEFVHFLVHDSVTDMNSYCLDLFELACMYEVIPLRQLCEQYFRTLEVTSETADRISILSNKYKSGSLLRAFMKYQSQKSEFKFAPSSIVEDLARASDEFYDVSLISKDNREVRCSSFLLLCRSKVFKRNLLKQNKPDERTTVAMSNFDGDVLEQFVHFLKTDTVKDMKHALQLLLLADQYRISKLTIDCIEYINSHIQEFDPYEVFEVSQKVSSAAKLVQTMQQTFSR